MPVDMLDFIRKIIAGFVVNRNLKSKSYEPVSFNNVYNNAHTFFVLMPDNEIDFHHALTVVNDLDRNGKVVTIMTRDFRISLLPQKFHRSSIGFGINEVTKLNLPTKPLCDKLNSMEFNFVIDLNREENLFFCYSANLVNAAFRTGVKKNNSDKYFNLQIIGPEDNSEMFYKNFLNCLQMF